MVVKEINEVLVMCDLVPLNTEHCEQWTVVCYSNLWVDIPHKKISRNRFACLFGAQVEFFDQQLSKISLHCPFNEPYVKT